MPFNGEIITVSNRRLNAIRKIGIHFLKQNLTPSRHVLGNLHDEFCAEVFDQKNHLIASAFITYCSLVPTRGLLNG